MSVENGTATNFPGDAVISEQVDTSIAILILISLLYCTLCTSYFLQRKQIRYVHETVVSIFLGLLVGFAIRMLSSSNTNIMQKVTFQDTFFFNMLLPPIILNSGFDMNRQSFFQNIGAILIFSLLGTFISTFVIGGLLYLGVSTVLSSLQLDLLDCMIIGAILSSTDPVTILSIFHQLKVDSKLYAIIFGESILNDSVAIVLVSTLGKLRGHDLTGMTVFLATLTFFGIFLGSIFIGVLLGLAIALLLKHTQMQHFPFIETSLIILQAYASYLVANSIQLSGIVALLFYGIVTKHYAYENMSQTSRETTQNMLRVLSQLAENFIFIYLGVAWFTKENQRFEGFFVLFTFAIILVARFFSVAPLALFINLYAKFFDPNSPHAKIPLHHQLMIWWAGLRGAIAFALSFEVSGVEKDAVQSTILVVCAVTVIAFGGSTPFALNYFQIETGVSGEPDDNVVEDLNENIELDHAFNTNDPLDVTTARVQTQTVPDHWFLNFDRKYLKPLFGRKTRVE